MSFQPKQQHETSDERLEVDHIVQGAGLLDEAERSHPDDGVDRDDEHEENADVEERGKGENEGVREFSDAFGHLDEAQEARDTKCSDATEDAQFHEVEILERF